MQLCCEQLVQKHIALPHIALMRPIYALTQQQVTRQSKLGAGGCSLPGVVGLHGAVGKDGVGPLFDGLGHQKLEFARFVAPGRKARAIIALQPDARSPKLLAQPIQWLQRRWTVHQGHSALLIQPVLVCCNAHDFAQSVKGFGSGR